jgi:hypothetical protein
MIYQLLLLWIQILFRPASTNQPGEFTLQYYFTHSPSLRYRAPRSKALPASFHTTWKVYSAVYFTHFSRPHRLCIPSRGFARVFFRIARKLYSTVLCHTFIFTQKPGALLKPLLAAFCKAIERPSHDDIGMDFIGKASAQSTQAGPWLHEIPSPQPA